MPFESSQWCSAVVLYIISERVIDDIHPFAEINKLSEFKIKSKVKKNGREDRRVS